MILGEAILSENDEVSVFLGFLGVSADLVVPVDPIDDVDVFGVVFIIDRIDKVTILWTVVLMAVDIEIVLVDF